MARFIGKGLLQDYSQEITLTQPITVASLPATLQIPDYLSNHLIFLRNHLRLSGEDRILNEDEVIIFVEVMGG